MYPVSFYPRGVASASKLNHISKSRDLSPCMSGEKSSKVFYNPWTLFCHGNPIINKGLQSPMVRGWAKEWSLGCVNPASWLPLAAGREFPQPGDHSFAQPCIGNRSPTFFNSNQFPPNTYQHGRAGDLLVDACQLRLNHVRRWATPYHGRGNWERRCSGRCSSRHCRSNHWRLFLSRSRHHTTTPRNRILWAQRRPTDNNASSSSWS